MKMPKNAFKAAIKAGEKQIGIWASLADPVAAELIAAAGYDWIVVDMEHSPASERDVLGQLQAIAPYTSALVRPPWNDTVMVKRLMDAGAPGLLFPMVQSAEEARAAVAAMRYPPKGVRGVAGTIRGSRWGRITDYLEKVEDETCVILQVETQAAMDAAVEIGTVDGCDGVFFGPADISADMGYLGQPLHDDVWARIRVAAKALMDKGVPVGTLVMDPDMAKGLLDEGFTFVAVATDTGLLANAADTLLARMKS